MAEDRIQDAREQIESREAAADGRTGAAAADHAYDREAAAAYAREWAGERNPQWGVYDGAGGNCTNYVSQCLYASGIPMDQSGDAQWYWYSDSSRAPAWTGVDSFRVYARDNTGYGLSAQVGAAYDTGEEGDVTIEPITSVEHVYLRDLVGYERQKKKLVENTEAFIEGREANNVLLFGDSGTGKSSSIKAILNEYYDRGLRMIEVYKHQFQCLSDILEQIKDRNYKFIVYMDDLSFEEYEIEYKYLKAMIEGGLGRKPDNVLIYATSNRRHLIREKFSDKRELDDDLHKNDTVQEKLSLVARFGVTIYYGAPDKKEFQNIVSVLAEKYHVEIPREELLLLANQWELSHGGLSGRTAAQFITHLLGTGMSNKEGSYGN